MILLDTNVISALIRQPIDPAVVAYILARPPDELVISTVCEAEILYGLNRLPAGRRREALTAGFQTFLADGFRDRILGFDSACAAASAEIRSHRDAIGRPMSFADAMIAGTARAHGASLATRNVADFVECGVVLENPWAQS